MVQTIQRTKKRAKKFVNPIVEAEVELLILLKRHPRNSYPSRAATAGMIPIQNAVDHGKMSKTLIERWVGHKLYSKSGIW